MKKTEEKNSVVKSAAKTSAAKKPAAAKSAVKTAKTAASKTAAAKKTTSKTTAKAGTKTAAKKTVRKSKPITIDSICKLVEKKIVKSKASAIKTDIAADIEVWGFEDGSNQKMYIEIKGGKVSVMPYSYEKYDFRVSLSFANAMDFANGKIALAKLLDSKDFYAEGNVVSALKLGSIF